MRDLGAGEEPGPGDVYTAARLFMPARLTLAREIRGLTKTELADRVRKTVSAISQFESGRVRPDGPTLGAMSLALGQPLAFFAREPIAQPLRLEDCHFRSLRSSTQRERRVVLATGTLLAELVARLAEHVSLPRECVSELSAPCETVDDIEARAQAVRRAWGLADGPIPNMVRLLEAHGVVVSFVTSAAATVDAMSTWCSGRPFVFLIADKDSTSRRRFDAAHELGHLVMHADASPGDPRLERQAHRFAGAFLLPRSPFLRECPRYLNWDHLYELKRRWGVSVQAIARRATDLGIFSRPTYRRFYVLLNQRGERVREPLEPAAEGATLIPTALEVSKETFPTDRLPLLVGLSREQIEAHFALHGTSCE